MTTIAARDGWLAYDSRITSDDGLSPDRVRKAWRSRRHALIWAAAGVIANANAAARALDAMAQLPWEAPGRWDSRRLPSLEGSTILAALADGRFFYIEESGWVQTAGPFLAIGSGAMAALAAMHMGASARRAVAVAIKLDHQSGGPVRALRISGKRA